MAGGMLGAKKKQQELVRQSTGYGLKEGHDVLTAKMKELSKGINDLVIDFEALIPDPDNRNANKEIDSLVDEIMMVGNLIHPLFVQDQGDGTYMIKSGERRWRALSKIKEKYPEEFKKKYEKLLCRVAGKEVDQLDIDAAAACGNLSAVMPTSEEAIKAVEKIRNTYLAKKERGEDVPDSVIDFISSLTNKAKRTVARTVTIVENLSEELKENVGKGNITLVQAESLSGLAEGLQEKAAALVKENGKLSAEDIAALKKEDKEFKEKNKKQIRNNKNYERTIKEGEKKLNNGQVLDEKEAEKVRKAKERLSAGRKELRRQITSEIIRDPRLEFEGALKELTKSISKLVDKKMNITLSEKEKTQIRDLAKKLNEAAGE